jgi:hypothetical protein
VQYAMFRFYPTHRAAMPGVWRERTSREEISYNTSMVSRAALRLSSVGGIALFLDDELIRSTVDGDGCVIVWASAGRHF